MVRDNWQTRVENADARRKESKQRKQRADEKRLYKGRVQDLLLQLDDYYASYLAINKEQLKCLDDSAGGEGERGKKQNNLLDAATLHIWSETDAVTKNALLDVLSTVGANGGGRGGGGGVDSPKRKARSSSAGNIAEGGVGTSRGRSDSLGGGGGCWSGSLGSGGDGHDEEIVAYSSGRNKGRGRSESFGGSGKNKKVHPRSKEQQQLAVTFNAATNHHHAQVHAAANGPWLCSKDFFHGKCPGNSNSGGYSSCRHVHYSSLSSSASFLSSCLTGTSLVTLESVLHNKSKKNQSTNSQELIIKTQLQQSERAATTSSMTDSNGETTANSSNAMDLLCHTAIDLSKLVLASPKSSSSAAAAASSLSELVTAALSSAEYQIPLSSIVYVVLHGTLVFDRHRNGIFNMPDNNNNISNMAEEEEQYSSSFQRPPGGSNRRTTSIGSEYDTTPASERSGGGVGDSQHPSCAAAAAFDVHLLPGPILEHMLTFLPDTAVAACSQTCKAWYHEIGQRSPNLWLHLLKRRNWPVPTPTPVATTTRATSADDSDEDEGEEDENEHAIKVQKDLKAHRDLFLKHYSTMRDVRAICEGITELLSNNGSSSSNTRQGGRQQQQQARRLQQEMALVDFTKHGRKFAPTTQDVCVALLEWSPKRILVGYARECSLRLFEAIPSSNNNNSCGGGGATSAEPENIRCKELVYQSVDPFACTKKRKCALKAVALDEERIGCLCSVTLVDTSGLRPVQRQQNESAQLVVVNRDDFLLGESSAVITKGGSKQQHAAGQVENLKVIDIGQAVLNYILTTTSNVDHDLQLLPLLDFLSDGGHVDDIIIQASWSLVACGYGRFLVEVSISLPVDGEDYDAIADGPPGLILDVDRALVLFSSDAGVIVWMGSCKHGFDAGNAVLASSPLYQPQCFLPTMQQNQAMAAVNHPGICTIAVRSNLGSAILVLDIDTSTASGHFGSAYDTHVIQESTLIREEILIRQQLAENRAVAGGGGEQVEWRYHLSNQLVVTSTDIISADCLQRHVLPNNNGDVDQIQVVLAPRLRLRKAILTFYPRYPSLDQASCETLTLPGMLRVEEMVTVRNDHVVAICSELRSMTSNDDNRHGTGNQQEQNEHVLVNDDGEVDEQEDNVSNEDDDSGGGAIDDDINGEAFNVRFLLANFIDNNNNNGNDNDNVDEDGNGSDATPLEEEYWGESLVVVVIHVPSRCEIGRIPLQKTTIRHTLDHYNNQDGCYWRPKMSSAMGQGGTIAMALDAAGIILTGEAVRSVGGWNHNKACNNLGHSSGGNVADEAKSPGGGAKKKKKNKVRKSTGGKKDGFARGMTLRG